ncbi:MAG: hypothetical protein ChlgKO_02540 [Chlamydiales bacterium]
MSWGLVKEPGSDSNVEGLNRLYAAQPDTQKEKAARTAMPVMQNAQPNTTQSLGTNRNITIA